MMRTVILVLLISMMGCGAVDSMTDGFKHADEVAADLEKSIGQKPTVGFNWSNGSLTSVNVTFPEVPEGKSLGEIVALSRGSIAAHFKQKPSQIFIAFSVAGASPVNTANGSQQKARKPKE